MTIPNDNFRDITRAARGATVASFIDDSTPEGHFGATMIFLGVLTTYLLKGELDDPNAPVVGRVEANMEAKTILAYRGTRLKGGEIISAYTYGEAFNKMV